MRSRVILAALAALMFVLLGPTATPAAILQVGNGGHSIDFETSPGAEYSFAADGNAQVTLSTDQAHGGARSAKLYLPSGTADFAKVIVPTAGKLATATGTFWTYLPAGGPTNLIPYAYFIVDANMNGIYDFGGVNGGDAIIIAFITGGFPYPLQTWIQSGLDPTTTVHVVGNRSGLGALEFSSSHGGGLFSDLLTRVFSGTTTWGDLNLLQSRIGAGEWPNTGAFTAYVDDFSVTAYFPTIQAAVDAAQSGDVIHVPAGTYVEQVVVDGKDITIEGEGAGLTIIRSPAILTTTFDSKKPVVTARNTSSVVFQDLTVDGNHQGNANSSFLGIAFWDAGGKVLDCSVVNVEDSPFSGGQHGVGIYSYNDTNGPYALEVGGTSVTYFQKNAMALSGVGMTVNVHDCVVTGRGYTPVTAQNGIQVGFGAGGTIADCAISDLGYIGTGWTASGILAYGAANLTISGFNPIRNNQCPVDWYDTNGTISGIDVNGPGSEWGPIFVYNTTTGPGKNARPADDLMARRLAAAVSPLMETGTRDAGAKDAQSVTVSDCSLTGTHVPGTAGVLVYSEGGPLSATVSNCSVVDWDYGLYPYGAATVLESGSNTVVSNTTAGYDATEGAGAQVATCNWWGAADGPGPSGHGDAVVGDVTYTPWWPANECTDNTIYADVSASGCLTGPSCVVVPVVYSRPIGTEARGASVTFQLSSNLVLCGAIAQGGWLDGFGNVFDVIDNGDGSYTVDQASYGNDCGPAGGGVLFTLNVGIAPGALDGAGSIIVTSVIVRDCANQQIPAAPGVPGMIRIDTVTPLAITDLAAAQVVTGNDTDGTTKVTLTFTAPPDAAVTEVYRAGFGHYPEYDDAGGSVPAAPAYPPGAPWALTAVDGSGEMDEVATRDYWYYVVFTKDACGNVSTVSNVAGGTLNYHLGDISNGITDGQGDNQVSVADISALGAHYGITLVPGDTYNYLDVGPTTDWSVNGRPTTDNRVNFEDLIVFAMNFGLVGKTAPAALVLGGAAVGPVFLELGGLDARVRPGQLIALPIVLRGAAEGVQGIHTTLNFDRNAVSYVSSGVAPALAGTGHFFKDLPIRGAVDLSLALLGGGASLQGEGTVMIVRFRALREGPVRAFLSDTNLRDTANRELSSQPEAAAQRTELGKEAGANLVPSSFRLGEARPNPFNSKTAIVYDLPSASDVRIVIYDASGRVVRNLFGGSLAAGSHSAEWDGTDDGGRAVGSGVYFYAMRAGSWTSQKRMTLLK